MHTLGSLPAFVGFTLLLTDNLCLSLPVTSRPLSLTQDTTECSSCHVYS